MSAPPRNSRIVDGPLRDAVLRLAGPVCAAETLHTAFHVVDVAWVGWLGPAATAAATTSMFAVWLLFAVASMINTGLGAHLSQAIGRGDEAAAGEVTTQGLHLALGLGVICAVAGWLFAPAIFALVDAPPDVYALGVTYLRITSLGAPATFLYLGGSAVMRAAGNTRTPMLIVGACVVTNVGLGPLLVYSAHLGVGGAAIATIICEGGAVLAFVRLVARRHPDFPIARASIGKLDWHLMGAMCRVGLPVCLMLSGFSIVYLFFSRFASAWGAAALAIVGASNRLESICYLPADGLAAAAATVVGQNLGAGRPARAIEGAWTAIGLVACFAAVLTALYLLFPRVMLSMFSRDPTVLADGVSYLRIIALCQIATGVETVVSGSFGGAGDTVPVLVVHAVFSVARVPLAWLLSHKLGMGINGIAWTISSTCIVRAAILVTWFGRGRWTRRALVLPVRRAVA